MLLDEKCQCIIIIMYKANINVHSVCEFFSVFSHNGRLIYFLLLINHSVLQLLQNTVNTQTTLYSANVKYDITAMLAAAAAAVVKA